MPQPKRAALYLRVSTGEQTTENQRLALQTEAERRGWQINPQHVYEDAGVSGATRRDKRPALARALQNATRGQYDVLMAWSLDRVGRSLHDLIGTLQELESARVDLFLHQQAIDTTGPAGRLFFHILGSFAEFERAMIRQRVIAGLERAKRQGTRLGRPRVDKHTASDIRSKLEDSGWKGVKRIARELEVGVSTVKRLRDQYRPPTE